MLEGTTVPDWQSLVACIRREGTPRRVHIMELFLDAEVQDALCARYGLIDRLDPGDPFFAEKRQVALQRFLGYDYVGCGVENVISCDSPAPGFVTSARAIVPSALRHTTP